MTISVLDSQTRFSFTAFLEQDLLTGRDRSLGRGDRFVVPENATVQFDIEDDDTALSGDGRRQTNDIATDISGQTGSFVINGRVFQLSDQIYIERVLVVSDANGQTYSLAEIEIAGARAPGRGDDFFTFIGAVPPAGVELTVVGDRNVAGEGIDFSLLGADQTTEPEPPVDGVRQVIDFDGAESGSLDARDFPGVTITAQRRTNLDERITIQAENLETDDFTTVYGRQAEGRKLVRLNQSEGELSTTFDGEAGNYDITLRLQDENDGQSEIDVVIDGVIVGIVVLANDNNGRGSNNGRFSDFTLQDIKIPEGAEVSFVARRDGGEFVRFDSVTFTRDDSILEDAAPLIFDSNNPTGGDRDLRFGDDNILIISEDDDASDPDDNRDGGILTFAFDTASFIESIDFIDIEESGELRLFDSNGDLITSLIIPASGNASVQRLDVNVEGVARFEVDLADSGAVDNVVFIIPDGAPQNNDPTVNAMLMADVTEDGAAQSFDLLEGASDVDGDILSVANLMGLVAGVSFDGVGSVTIDPSGASFQSLAVGATQDITINFDIEDGNGGSVAQTLTITVTGTNDAPMVDAALADSAAETDASFTIDLLEGAVDVDDDAILSAGGVTFVSGNAGGVTQTGDSLTVDPSFYIDLLGDSEQEVITYTFDITDENGATLTQTGTVTITGATVPNSPPTVNAMLTADVTEDGAAQSFDLLEGASDVDGDALSVANLTGLVAGVSFDGVGSVTIDPSGASFQSLAVGATQDITINFDIEDGNGGSVAQTLTITVTGTNDAPMVDAALADSAAETDASFTIDLLEGASDVDDDAILSVGGVTFASGNSGGVTQTGDSLTVDPSFYIDLLGDSEQEVITYTFDITDENGATVTQTGTITITGATVPNSPPTVNAMLTADVTEDGAAQSFDLLEGASDVDGDTLSVANLTGLVAGVSFDGVSSVTIDPSDASFQSLAAGVTQDITINFDIEDGNGGSVAQTLTITVTGTNDAPMVDAALMGAVVEDGAEQSFDLLEGASDVDGDTLSVTDIFLVGAFEVLETPISIADIDGIELVGSTLNFDPSADIFQNLPEGVVGEFEFFYTISDGNGGEVSQSLTVSVTGANDAPQAFESVNSIEEGEGITGTSTSAGNLFEDVIDVDVNSMLSVTSIDGVTDGSVGIVGEFGTLFWDTVTGEYTYELDDANPIVHAIREGEQLTETFTFIVSDELGTQSNPAPLTITINGIDDGIFTKENDNVDLAEALNIYGTIGFNENFDDALGGDDNVTLLSGQELNDNPAFSDIFNGGEGDDTIILNDGAVIGGEFVLGQGADGGAGSDTIDFGALTTVGSSGVTFDLSLDVATFTNSSGQQTLDAANFENALGTQGNDLFVATADTNRFEGRGGNDTFQIIVPTLEEDIFIGGDGTDTITNLSGQNLVFANFDLEDDTQTLNGSSIEVLNLGGTSIVGTDEGGVFNFSSLDVNEVGNGGTLLFAGNGDDIVTSVATIISLANGVGTAEVIFNLGGGNDRFTGVGGSIEDFVDGGAGDDTIDGGGDTDTLIGGAGADVLIGGAGNDFFIVNDGDQSELDTFLGGSGADVIVNETGGDLALNRFDTSTDGVSGFGIEDFDLNGGSIAGSSGNDFYDFSTGFNFLNLNADTLLALSAGDGNDTVIGTTLVGTTSDGFGTVEVAYDLGAGNDRFTGVGGSIEDFVDGGEGDDTIDGGGDTDTLIGGAGADVLIGGAGNDFFIVNDGDQSELDTFLGGSGVDVIVNETGGDLALNRFDTSTDGVSGFGVEDINLNNFAIAGSSGDDFYDFSAGFNFLNLNADTLLALSAGDGNDIVVGTSLASVTSNGAATVEVAYDLGGGNDRFTGIGGSIEDFVDGGAGNDTIDGGGDTDTLIGGAGADVLNGGGSNDFFIVNDGDQSELDTFLGGSGVDVIVNETGGDLALNRFDTSTDGDNGFGIEDIDLNGGSIAGSSGDDFYDFSTGFNFLNLNADTLLALSAGDGNDIVVGTSLASVTSNGAATVEVAYDLGAGNDRFTGVGGSIEDFVDGGAGNDTIDGGGDTDTLIGGSGDDELTGGASADVFIFSTEIENFGNDLITDFSVSGGDIIDLSGVSEIMDFDDLINNHLTADADGNAVITIDADNVITLQDVDEGSLTMGDFLFA